MEKNVITKKEKYIYIEILRIVAIFFVIFNHTNLDGFFLFLNEIPNTPMYWIYLFISIFCKFSVPIFFMISGALLLDKNESIISVWKKRILKDIFVLIGISTFYYIIDIRMKAIPFNIKDYLSMIYTGNNQKYHLWFLNQYIAFLIVLPILKTIAKNIENKTYEYLILITILYTTIIPIFEKILLNNLYTLNSNIKVPWIAENIFIYPLIGYYFHNKFVLKDAKKVLPLLWISNIICIIISCCLDYIYVGKFQIINDDIAQMFHNSFTILNAICIFLTIKNAINNKRFNGLKKKIILSMGNCTFGIYLIHIFLMENIQSYYIVKKISEFGINKMVIAFIWSTIIFIESYIIVLILKKLWHIIEIPTKFIKIKRFAD